MIEFLKKGGLVIFYNFGVNLSGFVGLKKIAGGPSLCDEEEISKLAV
jgi:hypothetical protein